MSALSIRMSWPQYRRRQCWVRVDLSPHEAEALSLLLLRQGHIVPHDDMIETLWPDADTQPLDAARYVAAMLRQLRAKLGCDKYQRGPIMHDHGRGWMIA